MEIQVQTTLQFGVCECSECGIKYGLPLYFKNRLMQNHNTFYCPNGHAQYFSGKSEAEKLREELKRKEQELANKVIEKNDIWNELQKTQKKLTRLNKGTCSCCKRTFQNLKRHMESKHPELVKK